MRIEDIQKHSQEVSEEFKKTRDRLRLLESEMGAYKLLVYLLNEAEKEHKKMQTDSPIVLVEWYNTIHKYSKIGGHYGYKVENKKHSEILKTITGHHTILAGLCSDLGIVYANSFETGYEGDYTNTIITSKACVPTVLLDEIFAPETPEVDEPKKYMLSDTEKTV